MVNWRENLFIWLDAQPQPASELFQIPPNRVIEIGTQVNV